MVTSDTTGSTATSDVIQRTILVIDDEPVNAHLISQLLQDHEVVTALNGTEGLSMAQDLLPDLILLDVNMPDMLGFEVCTRLRANLTTRDIPVIFITTMDSVEDKMRAFEAGGLDYVVKPYYKEEVVARVNTHLALRAARLDLETHNRQLIRYKGVLEQLVLEKISGTTTHVSREGDYGSLLGIIDTVAQIDEGHRGDSRDQNVVAELESVRTYVREMIRGFGPRLRKLREMLAAASEKGL